MNNISKMPDCYNKSATSNLYKLMELLNLYDGDYKRDINDISSDRGVEFASGKTLDYYGEMVGEPRNGATDTQYRINIFQKIGRTLSSSNCDAIITLISQMFGIQPTDFELVEGDTSVTIAGLDLALLESTGYKSSRIGEMIADLIPAGVELKSLIFAGTLAVLDIFFVGLECPVLFAAWFYNQQSMYNGNGECGLSGYGEVPASWGGDYPFFQIQGTYSGGTLALTQGEDE